MSFNTRILAILIIIVLVLLALWYVAAQHLPAAIPLPAAQSTTTDTVLPTTSIPTQESPDLPTATANIVGSWQSTDDPNYAVKITADGEWTDSYGSDASATETGKYTLFTSTNPDKNFTGVLVPGVVYLKIVEGNSTLYYSVVNASGNALQISYLDRGNTLSFVRAE